MRELKNPDKTHKGTISLYYNSNDLEATLTIGRDIENEDKEVSFYPMATTHEVFYNSFYKHDLMDKENNLTEEGIRNIITILKQGFESVNYHLVYIRNIKLINEFEITYEANILSDKDNIAINFKKTKQTLFRMMEYTDLMLYRIINETKKEITFEVFGQPFDKEVMSERKLISRYEKELSDYLNNNVEWTTKRFTATNKADIYQFRLKKKNPLVDERFSSLRVYGKKRVKNILSINESFSILQTLVERYRANNNEFELLYKEADVKINNNEIYINFSLVATIVEFNYPEYHLDGTKTYNSSFNLNVSFRELREKMHGVNEKLIPIILEDMGVKIKEETSYPYNSNYALMKTLVLDNGEMIRYKDDEYQMELIDVLDFKLKAGLAKQTKEEV